MNDFSEMYNAQTQAYIDVKVPLSPSVLLRNPPPSRREAFFICDVGADSYATTHPPPSRPLYGSHTSHGQRREDCGPPVSLRLGHARGALAYRNIVGTNLDVTPHPPPKVVPLPPLGKA